MNKNVAIFLLLTLFSFKISAGDAIEQGVYAFVQGNYLLAEEKLKPFSDSGNPIAQYYLGIQYLYGYGVPQSSKKAFDLLYKSAQQNHAEAQYILGKMYTNGNAVKQSETEAIKWFTQSANLGYEYAANHLGDIYENGIETKKDRSKAIKWYTKAADLGHKNAITHLKKMGIKYAKKTNRELTNNETIQQARDTLNNNKPEVAKQIIQPLANVDVAEAQLLLANIYYLSDDKVLAYEWTLKAAENGLAQAQNLVGYFNYYSMGIDNESGVNVEQAIFWYQKAVDQDHTDAINNLGQLLLLSSKQSEQIYAYQLLLRAAIKEHPKAIATLIKTDQEIYNNLFYKITLADFIESNKANSILKKAILAYQNKQYRKAAAVWKILGHAGHTQSQINFALMYLDAQGVNKSLKKALNWLNTAATQENLDAQLMLAEIYSNNDIGKNPTKQALKWYKKAIKSEDGKAQYQYGMYLLKVKKDSKQAISWLTRAAENNYFQANLVLGYIYKKGIGIKVSEKKARYNYKIATENGLSNINPQENQNNSKVPESDDWKSSRERYIRPIIFEFINPNFSHFKNYPQFFRNLSEE